MDIRIIKEPISRATAKEIAAEFYGDMVKGAADIERRIIALGGEYHIDANNVLIGEGSKQEDIWGFNLYLDKAPEEWLEYTALINIRPASGNSEMYISDSAVREKLEAIVNKLIS